jgi:predicted Fe-S protein YdhL (DUF1289 family)
VTIVSPCTGACALDPEGARCLGCRRTLDEIVNWAAMTEAAQDAVLRRLAGREA